MCTRVLDKTYGEAYFALYTYYCHLEVNQGPFSELGEWVNSSPAKSQLAETEFDGGLYRVDRDYHHSDGFLFSLRVHQEIQEKEGLLENQYVTCRVWINAGYFSQGASEK